MSWKSEEFVSLPEELKGHKASIKEGDVTVEGAKLFYQEVNHASEQVPQVLLLHGKRFKSDTWAELGTLDMIGSVGFRAVAVDLPGYGRSESKDVNAGTFLKSLIEELKLERVVIVSPSLSGMFALPYILSQPSAAAGYIPIAPITTGDHGAEAYTQCKIPTLIVYGSKDAELGESSCKDLKQLPNSKEFVMNECNHACYLDNPDLWHEALFNFLAILEEEEKKAS